METKQVVIALAGIVFGVMAGALIFCDKSGYGYFIGLAVLCFLGIM